MSRSLPIWLLASALVSFVGCGGGDATDSGAVASNADGTSAPAAGGTASPAEGSGMPGSSGGTEMSAEMSNGSAGEAGDSSTAATPDYSPGGGYGDASGGESSEQDAAAMAQSYEAGEGGYPGGAPGAADYAAGEGEYPGGPPGAADYAAGEGAYPGSSPEEMEGRYGAGGPPGAGTEGAEAYAGGEYPGGPGAGAVEERVPEGFDGKAQLAFRRGKERDALRYLYAYALTTDAGAESLLPTIRWVGGLRQPKLAVRWGVGFVVTAPRNFNGDPKPVGSQQDIPKRGGNRDSGAGGSEGFGSPSGAADYGAAGESGGGGGGSNSLLTKGAGELGEKLIAAYTERVMRGDFGEVLKTALGSSSGKQGNAGGEAGAGYGAAGYGAPGAAGPGYGAKSAAEGAGGGGGGEVVTTAVTQIMPGLSMLGIGTQKELIERAREDGIDAVVIIDVKLRVNTSNGLVTNESTLALLDSKTQKKLHTTRKFNNITIQTARADGKEDGVDKELEGLFKAIDESFKMTDLPAGLNAEVASKRVAALAADNKDDPLPILAEARMYHSKGLLEESALFTAYEQILNVDAGRLLATGTEEDKKQALARWLPES